MPGRRVRIVPLRLAALAARDLAARQGLPAFSALIAVHGAAQAGTSQAAVKVKAKITAECLIGDANLDFGAFPVFAGTSLPVTTNTVSASIYFPIACTNGSAATIFANHNPVTLTGAAKASHKIEVTLAQDGAFLTAFPTSAAAGIPYTGDGGSATETIYGEIVATPTTQVDVYSGVALLKITY